jgi:hypothetical protein
MTPIIVQSDMHLGANQSKTDTHRAYKAIIGLTNYTRSFSDFDKNAESSSVNTLLSEAVHKVAPAVFAPKPYDPFNL